MAIDFIPVKTPEQIRTLAALADEVWHEFFVCILTPQQIDYMVDRFQSEHALTDQIGNQHYEYYLLRKDGVNIGYTGIKPENGKLFLSKLYILKAYRGQGNASPAFEFLRNVCRERGLGAVWLTVNRHNEHSVAVYRKKGFETVRTQIADIGNGFVMDDFIMEMPVK